MNKTTPAYILGFMLIITALFGIAISAVHYATLDMLRKNEQLHKNRILCNAFMIDVAEGTAEAYERALNDNVEKQSLTVDDRTWEVYRRKGDAPEDIGLVFTGMGFWGRITGVMVLSPDLKEIMNIKFLEQKETPGLGARIEERWFTDQFKGLQIAWDNPAEERIIVGSSPDPQARNRVDAITGASQTSMSVMKIINSELEEFSKAYARLKVVR
jgi:Na+-transporting NADH:ubiquinone oxidoreductase subunit C